jgi:hypothetical protein
MEESRRCRCPVSVAVGFVAGAIRLAVAFAARTPDGATEKLGLLVILLRKAIPAPRLLIGRLLPRAFAARLGILLRRLRLVRALLAAILTAVGAIILPIEAMLSAIAEAMLIMPAARPFEALIVHPLLRLMLVLACRLHRRLDVALVPLVVAELVARLHALLREWTPPAVHAIAARAHLTHVLLAEGHDDAVVVLGVLQIVLREHRIA